MLAKQAVLQGVVQDRLAQAEHIHQQKHDTSLLMPGSVIDIWRKPTKKGVDGWKGPADLVSLERKAGSAIVKH